MSHYFIKDGYPFYKTQQCVNGELTYKCCTPECSVYISLHLDGATVIADHHNSHIHDSLLNLNQSIKIADEKLFRTICMVNETVMKVTNKEDNSRLRTSNIINNESRYKQKGKVDEEEINIIREISTLHGQLLHQMDELASLREKKSTKESDLLHSSRPTTKKIKHRVMLIGDTHICNLRSILVKEQIDKCIIETKCKAGSEIQVCSKKALASASNYSEQDIVIFVGGLDFLNYQSVHQHFCNIRKLAEHTNVLQYEIAVANSRSKLFSTAIREFNHYLYLRIILSRHPRLRWQKLKFEFDDFIRGTNHLNEHGKLLLAYNIINYLMEFFDWSR